MEISSLGIEAGSSGSSDGGVEFHIQDMLTLVGGEWFAGLAAEKRACFERRRGKLDVKRVRV